MKFIQFWHRSAVDPTKIVPACGSDAVRTIDGRWGLARTAAFVEGLTLPQHYIAYSVHKGRSFSDEGPISSIIRLPRGSR